MSGCIFGLQVFFHLLACSMASCRPFAGLLNFFCLFNQTAFFFSACSKTEKFLCPRCQSFSCFRTSVLSINKSFHSRNLADGTVHHSIAQARESTFGSFPAICSTFKLVPFWRNAQCMSPISFSVPLNIDSLKR